MRPDSNGAGSAGASVSAEHRRVKDVYQRRYAQERVSGSAALHGMWAAERWQTWLDLLSERRLGSEGSLPAIPGRTQPARPLLDLGCGAGAALLQAGWIAGVPRDGRIALDLFAPRVRSAAAMAAGMPVQGSGLDLPFRSESVGSIICSTVASSIPTYGMRRRLYQEMWRCLRPGGAILWSDMAVKSIRNREVVPIRRRELELAFPHAQISAAWRCLAPPIAQALPRRALGLAPAIQGLPFVNVHLTGVIWKPAA